MRRSISEMVMRGAAPTPPRYSPSVRGEGKSKRQLEAGRELEAAGEFGHFGLHLLIGLGAGVVDGGDDEVFQHRDFIGIDELGIDLDAAHLALAGDGDRDHAAAGDAGHFRALEGGLDLLHLGLHGLGLLHHLAEILHASGSPSTGGSTAAERSRMASIVAPGKAAIAACTRGCAVTSARSRRSAADSCWASVGSPGSLEMATTQ